MTAALIDGTAIAASIREGIRAEAEERAVRGLRPPGLAVILVGENPASQAYVRMKTRACREADFHSEQIDLSASTTQEELLGHIVRLNDRAEIDGILVQLPLPRHIEERTVLEAVDPMKDVDGFHPVNMGLLAAGRPRFVPCTPLGIRELLLCSSIETRGRFAVIVGRSRIVGNPLAQLLSAKSDEGGNATVCLCHSATRDIAAFTRQADIVVAAMGSPEFIEGGMLKPGAVVIDVGINRLADAREAKGYRLVGDVHFESAANVASAITPVPGGVGPMTIAMLLRNTLDSAKRRAGG